jgi:ubiquitin-activating enzyme E1
MAAWLDAYKGKIAADGEAAQQEAAEQEAKIAALRADAAFMDQYSRQIGAYGLEAMLKLISTKVLVIGMKGIGVEVAKNAALAGVHTLAVYDTNPTEIRDLGTNFFLTPGDVGKPRGEVCTPKIGELNPSVRCVSGARLPLLAVILCERHLAKWLRVCSVKALLELSEAVVRDYTAVVFTQGTYADKVKWDTFCRSQPVPIFFCATFTGGAMGSIFVDPAPTHTIKDVDGKLPFIKIVDEIEQKTDEDGAAYLLVRYTTPDGQNPSMLDEDGLIEFSDVPGCVIEGLEIDGAPATLNSISKTCSLRGYRHHKDPVHTCRICMPDKNADGNRVYVNGLTPFDSSTTSAGCIIEVKSKKEVWRRPPARHDFTRDNPHA